MLNNELMDCFLDNESKDNYETFEKENVVIIDGRDRNIDLDTNYNFSVSFNSMISTNMNINRNFKNIVRIEIDKVFIPNIYIDQKEALSLYNKSIITSNKHGVGNSNPIKLRRVSDLPYINLTISEIKNENMIGTNSNINQASYILFLEDIYDKSNNNSGFYQTNGANIEEYNNINNSTVAERDKRLLKYMDYHSISFYNTPKNFINSVRMTLTTPQGELLSNLNDSLTIKNVSSDHDSSPTLIILETTKYFCTDEYEIGDTILLSNVDLNNVFCKQFLMKKKGHTIIGHGRSSGKGTGTTRLYNQIKIPYEYDIDLDPTTNAAGDSTINNTLGLTTSTIDVNSGTIINGSLQIYLALKITTEHRTHKGIHANIL